MTYDLVEWLRLQLDDDERVAREADQGEWLVGVLSGAFYSNGEPSYDGHIEIENGEVWPKPGEIRGTHIASKPAEDNGRVIADMNRGYLRSRHEQNADHIARWDPARVLREVQAKRKILDEHHRIEQRGLWHKGTGYETEFIRAMCVLIGDDEDQGGSRWRYREHAEWPCRTVLFLAAIYSDRPGYREEWRPGDTPPHVSHA